MLIEFKHQGSTAEKSSAQSLIRAFAENVLNIVFGCLFLVLFWASKKEQTIEEHQYIKEVLVKA